MAHLIRTLSVGCQGSDVDGVKRTVYRGLDSIDGGHRLKAHNEARLLVRQTFGLFFRRSVTQLEKLGGLNQDGRVPPHQYEIWQDKGYPDALAKALIDGYAKAHSLTLCYPQPDVPGVYVGQGLHPTEGIYNNWAIDFMAPGGTEIFASYDGEITRFSGHDPKTGTHGPAHDIFGWSLYMKDAQGREGYLTHMGERTCSVGQKVKAGEKIGSVGHWPGEPGRSHTHEGISSPLGVAEAKARITQISKAKKLPAL